MLNPLLSTITNDGLPMRTVLISKVAIAILSWLVSFNWAKHRATLVETATNQRSETVLNIPRTVAVTGRHLYNLLCGLKAQCCS